MTGVPVFTGSAEQPQFVGYTSLKFEAHPRIRRFMMAHRGATSLCVISEKYHKGFKFICRKLFLIGQRWW
jgi:hypothetical protein